MNDSVRNVLKNGPWYLATMSAEMPNVVPVGLTHVTEDGKLLLGDVMMAASVENVKANGKAAVTVYDPATREGYQVKGNACYRTEGAAFEGMSAAVSEKTHGAMKIRGVIILEPTAIIVTTPGPDNKKVL